MKTIATADQHSRQREWIPLNTAPATRADDRPGAPGPAGAPPGLWASLDIKDADGPGRRRTEHPQ